MRGYIPAHELSGRVPAHAMLGLNARGLQTKLLIIYITSAMQSINGASLKEHWATQHCLHGSNSTTT